MSAADSATTMGTPTGTLFGVGLGPGDPELLTLKAVRVLQHSQCIYVPTSRLSNQDYVAEVVNRYADQQCEIQPVTFSLAATAEERKKHWQLTAADIASRLRDVQDVAFVTLGDPLLYSTYIYLIRAVRQQMPEAQIETVPGISAFSFVAALTNIPLGEGLQPLTVIPSSNDLNQIKQLINAGGGVVLMKIGRRLQQIIDAIDQADALQRSVFVSRAGLPDQRIETDLNQLRSAPEETGNLAVIIVQGKG
ncbi:MAG: precorrin-2 C(20)-methyltransferase [Desulfuromonas sp.]|nr:precorrin-2 C(20)-methyltransferase [Desulfuromonas sp.]